MVCEPKFDNYADYQLLGSLIPSLSPEGEGSFKSLSLGERGWGEGAFASSLLCMRNENSATSFSGMTNFQSVILHRMTQQITKTKRAVTSPFYKYI